MHLPELILDGLRQRAREGNVETRTHGAATAFILAHALDHSYWLTDGGSFLVYDGTERRLATEDEVVHALVMAASRLSFAALLELVPPMPPNGTQCRECHGTRRMSVGSHEMVCMKCSGRGWTR